MLGKTAAIGYTFLWSFAYGFIISIVLALILKVFISTPTSDENKEGEINGDLDSLSSNLKLISFAAIAAAITQLWLVFGTAYNYGLGDCPEANK